MGGLSSIGRLEAYALFCVRYPHPKSLPSGKGLALALAGSKSGVSHLRNLSTIIDYTTQIMEHFQSKSQSTPTIPPSSNIIFHMSSNNFQR